MSTTQRIGWGLVGAATTMLVRAATRRALIDDGGQPRLPRSARRTDTFSMMIGLAAATGALLALSDVLKKQRSQIVNARI